MPRKKTGRAKRKVPSRIKILAGILAAFLIFGVAGVKFLQTPRGSVFLLGKGFSSHYARAQSYIQAGLVEALREIGLYRNVKTERVPVFISGRRFPALALDVSCPDKCDFVKINVALTRASRRRGARVITSREKQKGNELVLEIGSGKFITHRVTVTKLSRKVEREQPERPRIALIIDDFGYSDNSVAEGFLALDLPITISVIPSLAYSKRVLSRAREMGKEVMLHLPMEPERKEPSDVPEVTTGMSDEEITGMVERYLNELDGVVGANNHMGSKATQDRRVMRAVLLVLKKRGLFFLDSLTSPHSIAYNVARDLGVKTARNDLFLDTGTEDTSIIEKRLWRLVDIAKKRGYAVGIAHPRKWTLEVFRKNLADLGDSGVDPVFLSEMVK